MGADGNGEQLVLWRGLQVTSTHDPPGCHPQTRFEGAAGPPTGTGKASLPVDPAGRGQTSRSAFFGGHLPCRSAGSRRWSCRPRSGQQTACPAHVHTARCLARGTGLRFASRPARPLADALRTALSRHKLSMIDSSQSHLCPSAVPFFCSGKESALVLMVVSVRA